MKMAKSPVEISSAVVDTDAVAWYSPCVSESSLLAAAASARSECSSSRVCADRPAGFCSRTRMRLDTLSHVAHASDRAADGRCVNVLTTERLLSVGQVGRKAGMSTAPVS